MKNQNDEDPSIGNQDGGRPAAQFITDRFHSGMLMSQHSLAAAVTSAAVTVVAVAIVAIVARADASAGGRWSERRH